MNEDNEDHEEADDLMANVASIIDRETESLLFQAVYGKLLSIGFMTAEWRDQMLAKDFSEEWCEEACMLIVRRLLLGLDIME